MEIKVFDLCFMNSNLGESIYEFDQEELLSPLVVTAAHYKGDKFATMKCCCWSNSLFVRSQGMRQDHKMFLSVCKFLGKLLLFQIVLKKGF